MRRQAGPAPSFARSLIPSLAPAFARSLAASLSRYAGSLAGPAGCRPARAGCSAEDGETRTAQAAGGENGCAVFRIRAQTAFGRPSPASGAPGGSRRYLAPAAGGGLGRRMRRRTRKRCIRRLGTRRRALRRRQVFIHGADKAPATAAASVYTRSRQGAGGGGRERGARACLGHARVLHAAAQCARGSAGLQSLMVGGGCWCSNAEGGTQQDDEFQLGV